MYFVDFADILNCSTQWLLDLALPPDWVNVLPGQMKKEAVPPNRPDYNKVIGEFKKTSPNFTIIKVCIVAVCT